MRAGALVHRVQLQSPGGSPDAAGWIAPSWTTVATVYASIRPISGREALLAAQRQSAATHQVGVRYSTALAGLDSTWRVLWGTRSFEIEMKKNVDERDRELELLCVEHLPPAAT